MDPTRIVGTTERTQMWDGRTDRRTDGRTEWNQYTPLQLRCVGGIINVKVRYIYTYMYIFININIVNSIK